MDEEVAVIGGGIVGASVAYHLSERTAAPVTVYERGELASATTFRATAMIGVAGPGPYHRMKEYGFRQYNDFFADPEAEPRYRQSGRLRVSTTDGGARELEALASTASERSGAEPPETTGASKYANSLVDYVPGAKLRDRFLLPPLNAGIVEGALYRPQYGYVQDDSRTLGPRELVMEFVERASANSVIFETGTEVTDIGVADGAVTRVELDGMESVPVESVVCAAGPWNAEIAALAGVDLPIEHIRSPVFALELADPLPYSLPMIKSHDASVGIHPKRDDTILVTYTPREDERESRLDPSAVSDTAPDEYRETALRVANKLLPRLEDAELVDEWVGVGTSTPDGKPIAGWTGVDGLALAATRAGIQYAPAVGDIVARQLVDGDPTEYYEAVSISRFDGYEDGRTVDGER
ncbi:NAD(P)/FAD-dependent oxidoreductase [Halosimplex aquaticum]|uniref:NAD(P)/FAD-dependent oxidoreductase n=1 Tax=Halosimplex aquaticum TaxID=3026162 RepID=A0ABD5Y172_9EURY|nr:FAD-binding oxidoreductase [Halosimplex aquaticum]